MKSPQLKKNFWHWKEFKVSWQNLCDSSARNYLVQFICSSRVAKTIWMLKNIEWCRLPPPFVHWRLAVIVHLASFLRSTYLKILLLIFEMVRPCKIITTIITGVRPHTNPVRILKAACTCPWFCVQRKQDLKISLTQTRTYNGIGQHSLNINGLHIDINWSKNLNAVFKLINSARVISGIVLFSSSSQGSC